MSWTRPAHFFVAIFLQNTCAYQRKSVPLQRRFCKNILKTVHKHCKNTLKHRQNYCKNTLKHKLRTKTAKIELILSIWANFVWLWARGERLEVKGKRLKARGEDKKNELEVSNSFFIFQPLHFTPSTLHPAFTLYTLHLTPTPCLSSAGSMKFRVVTKWYAKGWLI